MPYLSRASRRNTVPLDYFRRLYDQSSDPCGLATEWYEARVQPHLADLPRRRYRRGFEAGSSVGLLTELLGASCDEIVAVPSCLRESCTRLAKSPAAMA